MIICISASNIKHAGENSTSYKACKLIEKLIKTNYKRDSLVEVISLVDYELHPCTGCGKCYNFDKCVWDDGFIKLYNKLIQAEALFIVSAHYAPIPSKLSILLEKIEQLAFLKRFNNEEYRSPLYRVPVGLVAHGGGTEEIIKYYRIPVIEAIKNALSYPVEMNIIKNDSDQTAGVIFPVKNVKKLNNSIFPIQEYDWDDIELRLRPLVINVLNEIK